MTIKGGGGENGGGGLWKREGEGNLIAGQDEKLVEKNSLFVHTWRKAISLARGGVKKGLWKKGEGLGEGTPQRLPKKKKKKSWCYLLTRGGNLRKKGENKKKRAQGKGGRYRHA